MVCAVAAVPVIGYTMLGPMACDSCTGATLEEFEQRYWAAVLGVVACLVLAVALLVGGWFAARAQHRSLGVVLTWLAPVAIGGAALLAVLLIRA